MKLQQMFAEYAVSHQNDKNIRIHLFCVPLIYFSIVGIILSIPVELMGVKIGHFLYLPVLIYYVLLSVKYAGIMLAFHLVCTVIAEIMANLLWISIAIFLVSWALQFYGHKIEGKKPSFLQDVFFLLIGPLWVFKKLFNIQD